MSDPTPSLPPSHQPPYDEARYARYEPEPWEDREKAASPRVWYCFIVFTVGVMLMGVVLLLMGLACHLEPAAILEAVQKSAMTPVVKTIGDVRSLAVTYFFLGSIYLLAGAIVFVIPHSLARWGYGIALIVLAAVSCFYLPFSLVMFIFWMLPTTRAYFQNEK